jgi:hypothetical protein
LRLPELPALPWKRLTGSGVNGTYSYELAAGPESHKRIRRLMREKYDWRDRWIGLLFDVSQTQLLIAYPDSQ